jgi:putative glycosyltransferase
MKLSIVATLYRSEAFVEEFCKRAFHAAREIVGDDFEVILVNDGSPDNSLQIAIDLTKTKKQLVVVDLSRNFGHHNAMIAGLSCAVGELVFLIDSDLEESPEWISGFHQLMISEKSDVVFGVQESRKGGFFERISGEIYYRFINAVFRLNHPRNITTARLMSKRYVKALLEHRESEIVISALWLITGFKQIAKSVVKGSRSGKSTYNVTRKISHLINTITSFSARPLTWIFFCGFALASLAFVYGIYLIYLRAFHLIAVDGFTSIMVSVWFLGGLNFLFLGVIGIYLSKVFSESKRRPVFIVREIYGRN